MSSFTQFSAELHTHQAKEASKILGDEYRWIDPGFEFYLKSDPTEKVIIERGYLSDGASIPKPLRWVLKPWGKYGQCAVVHDKLCETWATNKRKLNRKEVDEIFFEAMKVAGVNVITRTVMEFGVNLYREVTKPSKPSPSGMKQVLTAQYVKDH